MLECNGFVGSRSREEELPKRLLVEGFELMFALLEVFGLTLVSPGDFVEKAEGLKILDFRAEEAVLSRLETEKSDGSLG